MAMELSTITDSIFMIMKKILSLLALAIIASCSTLTPSSDNETLIKKFSSYDVTLPEVEKYAYAKYGNTKGSLIDIDALVRDSDTLGYVLNYGEGWEVLSGDKRCTPIMAKGDGYYHFDSLIPPQKIWFESELEKIGAIKDGYGVQTKSGPSEGELFWQRINAPTNLTKAEGDPEEDNQHWELMEIIDWDYDVNTTGHLTQTKWGQEDPWNQYCPIDPETNISSVAGCWPVAVAQLLYHLHYNINKPSRTFSEYDYDTYECITPSLTIWDKMKRSLYDSDTTKKSEPSAVLIRWIGKEMNVNYGSYGTSGNINKFISFINNIPNLISGEQSITYRINEYGEMLNDISHYLFNRRQPCLIRAHTNEFLGAPTGDGHTWLIDGYRREIYTYKYVYRWTSRTDNHLYEYGEIREDFIEVQDKYIMMNWGWNGLEDNNLYSPNTYSDWIVIINQDTCNLKYGREVIYDFN